MTTTPTNNPVPSDHPADARDNFKRVDEFVNLNAPSTSPTRTSKVLLTIQGIIDRALNAIRNSSAQQLNGGAWAAGIQFTEYNQYMIFNGVAYKPKTTTTLPYTSTATPDTNFVEPFTSFNENLVGDYTNYIFSTVANVSTGTAIGGNQVNLTAGMVIAVVERGIENKFIVGTGTANGMNIIQAGGSLVATLSVTGKRYVSARAYGAVFDNTTDIGPVLNQMISDGVPISIPNDQAVINTTVNIAANTVINFMGSRLRTTNLIAMFSATSVDNWSLTGSATLTGTAPGAEAAQHGIQQTGCEYYKVENINAYRMRGTGFRFVSDGVLDNRAEHGQWNNCHAYECQVGWDIPVGTSVEYTVLTGCSATKNVRGARIGAGNTNWNGGNIVDNTIGVELVGGGNEGHGIFSGVNINHNTQRNVNATNVANGYTFDGCHFYANGPVAGGTGRIVITNSKQFNFNGGTLACGVEVFRGTGTSNGTNVFKNMYVNVDSWAAIGGDDLNNIVSSGHWSDAGLRTDLIFPKSIAITNFQNGWSNFGSGRSDLAFTIGENGIITLSGAINGGTTTFGTVIASIPSNYAPDLSHDFIVDTGSVNTGTAGFIQIEANSGNIVWRSGDATRVSLTGISFPITGGDAP